MYYSLNLSQTKYFHLDPAVGKRGWLLQRSRCSRNNNIPRQHQSRPVNTTIVHRVAVLTTGLWFRAAITRRRATVWLVSGQRLWRWPDTNQTVGWDPVWLGHQVSVHHQEVTAAKVPDPPQICLFLFLLGLSLICHPYYRSSACRIIAHLPSVGNPCYFFWLLGLLLGFIWDSIVVRVCAPCFTAVS